MAKSLAYWARRNGVEVRMDELRGHAVCINSDGNTRGHFNFQRSHTREHFINDVAPDVQDSEIKLTGWKRAQLKVVADSESAEARGDVQERHHLRLNMLVGGARPCGVPQFPRNCFARDRIWRRGSRRGSLPPDLRRFLLVHAFQGTTTLCMAVLCAKPEGPSLCA